MNADAPYYRSQAFGPRGLRKTIADGPVTVILSGCGHVVVTDDREAHHDFQGARWSEIVTSMEQYFYVVETGL
jgi:hypothetical protein